jgi:hypothetical protein
MTARLRLLVLSPLVLIVLITAAVFPLAALAEEATPPPPEVTEVTSSEEAPPADPVEASSTEEAPTMEPTEPSGAETVPPTDPAEAPPTEEAPATEPTEAAPVEAPPDNLAATIPEGTDVVVLDEDGEALPLASIEAAEIIASGDPMWCPDGVAPGGTGCTGGSLTISGRNVDPFESGLAHDMLYLGQDKCQASPPAAWCGGAGTIYIAANYDTDNEIWWPNLEIDDYEIGATGKYYFGDLTIQGGWDFSQDPDHQPAGTTSTFNKPFRVDWLGNVTLNDLIFEEIDTVGGIALNVQTTGNITLDHVQVLDNDGVGAYLDNCADGGSGCTGTGSIIVSDSKFNRQGSGRSGLEAYTAGGIGLTNVEASGNDWMGAYLIKYGTSPGIVSITGGNFNDNRGSGLFVQGDAIDVNNVSALRNGHPGGWQGAILDNCVDDGYGQFVCPSAGHIDVADSTFDGNFAGGLNAYSLGDISLSGVFARNNGWLDADGNGEVDEGESIDLWSYGADLNNCLSDGDPECSGNGFIHIVDSVFTGNHALGVQASSSGEISLTGTDASGNGLNTDFGVRQRSGAALNNEFAVGSPGITVDQSTFVDNPGVGLFARSLGDIQVTGSEASGNGSAAVGSWDAPEAVGALLDNCLDRDCLGSGNILVSNSVFNENFGNGLGAVTFGSITVNGIAANSNSGNGAWLTNDTWDMAGTRSAGDITITGPSTFGTEGAGNGGSGVVLDGSGNITLANVVASYNGSAEPNEWNSGFGIMAFTEGEDVSISLTNATASHNWEEGLYLGAFAGPAGGPALGITLTDVVANSNGGDGGDLETDGHVWVDPSSFSDNEDDGLFVGGVSALVECSTFTGNGNNGLSASVDGTITVSGCTFGGNGGDNIDVWDGELVITAGNCPQSGGGVGGGGDNEAAPPPLPGTLPVSGGAPTLNVVSHVGEQQVVELVCTGIAGTVLQLSNGDHVELPCPIEGSATLHHQGEDTLPAGIDGDLTYLSGIHLGMAPDAEAVQGLGASIGLHFAVPGEMQGATLVVLHWDNGQWEQLSGSLSADGFFEAPHGQTGIYVLAAG